MSTPPPPPGYGYVPRQPVAFSKAQVRAQQRMAAAQARALQMQARATQRGLRMQRRAFHRSVVGPILLVALGLLLFLGQTGHLDWGRVLSWYSRWWPAILIGTGSLLLLEWFIDQRVKAAAMTGPRVLGPGVGLLLLLLASVGWSLGWFTGETRHRAYGFVDQFGLHRLLSQSYDWDDVVDTALGAGAQVTVHNPHGGITVTGTSRDGQVHVTLHKKVYAWGEGSAEQLRQQLAPTMSRADGNLLLELPLVAGAEADLTLEVPEKTAMTLRADRGDTSVSNLQQAVTVFSRDGDLTMNDIHGSVNAHLNSDSATVTGHNVVGSIRLQGRTGDLQFSDIDGSLSLEGDFFGSTHLEHVTQAVLFQTSRTHFEAAHLPGSLDLDGSPTFQADGVVGPLVLTTKNRNITLDNVSGGVQVTNRNGSVNLTTIAPLGALHISNQRGTVDIALPQKAGFQLSAETRNGDLENDYGLQVQQGGDGRSVSGTIAGGGPEVHVVTSDGGITIRKTMQSGSVPAPPAPPSPPSPSLRGKHLREESPSLRQM